MKDAKVVYHRTQAQGLAALVVVSKVQKENRDAHYDDRPGENHLHARSHSRKPLTL